MIYLLIYVLSIVMSLLTLRYDPYPILGYEKIWWLPVFAPVFNTCYGLTGFLVSCTITVMSFFWKEVEFSNEIKVWLTGDDSESTITFVTHNI